MTRGLGKFKKDNYQNNKIKIKNKNQMKFLHNYQYK